MTAGLYSPSIVWNTEKRNIVARMTNAECGAIAKRSTYNLRDRSPEIRRYLEQCGSIRLKYAKLLFTQQLVNANLLGDDEVAQYKRMSRVAQAQLKHHGKTAQFYQNEAGYRICCLIKIADHGETETLQTVLGDLDHLNKQQKNLDQATLLEDLMRIILKRGSKYSAFNVAAQMVKYEKALTQYTQVLKTSLEQCTRVSSNESVADNLEHQKALHPTLSDSTQVAMSEFGWTKACFEMINREHSTHLAEVTTEYIETNPTYKLQAA